MEKEIKIFAVLTIEDRGEFNLCRPTFPVYAKAIQMLQVSNGSPDMVTAGKVIFDACYIGNNGLISDIYDDVKLYVSLCIQSANLIEVFEGNVKKN